MAETFSYIPTKDSTRAHQPRVKKIAFGNGYAQVYGDGINSNLEQWSLTFEEKDADKQTIEDFFSARGGYQYFNWTSPEAGATQKQYLCTNWQIKSLGAGFWSITATFEEWAGLV